MLFQRQDILRQRGHGELKSLCTSIATRLPGGRPKKSALALRR
jgi:hypothetical protein